MSNLHRATTGIQEAYLAADACLWVIGGYVGARVVSGVTKAIEGVAGGGRRAS
jgi:hypothetical protein